MTRNPSRAVRGCLFAAAGLALGIANFALAAHERLTVQRGDTLFALARKYQVSVSNFRDLNRLPGDGLKPGQVLAIPHARATQAAPSAATRAAYVPPPTGGDGERLLWPLDGVMTQRFSYCGRKCGHAGLDIAAPIGTPVYAALSGVVISSGWDPWGYGLLVVVRGVDGRDYYYAHNSKLLPSVGERVAQGEVIALVGSTGRSSGPHLHFEVRDGTRILNPLSVLPKSRTQLASERGP